MINKIKNNWEQIKEHIKKEYVTTDVSYSTWIEPLIPNKLTKGDQGDNVLELIVPEAPYKEFLKKKYSICIRASIEEITGVKCLLSYVTEAEISGGGAKSTIIDDGRSQVDPLVIYKSNLNPNYTFDNFVVGKNNSFAHAASLAVAETPGEIYNPLFLYGGVGLGKTHLMHAIAHFILEKNPDTKVLYVRSEDFTNELIKSIQTHSMEEFRNKYRKNDVLLIDDIQFIIGKEATQEEFFWTFNSLYESKKQIIISSDKPPKEFDTLEDRLRSRFEMGLTVDIQKPDYENRVAILRKKEQLAGYNVDDEVIKYIATNVKDSIRELEGALTKIVFRGKLDKKEVNLEMAQEVLKDIINPDEEVAITPEVIINIVCEHYQISQEDIKSIKRNKEIVYPRQIAMYLIRNLTNTSLEAIGNYLGNRDHTTIIHGIDKISTEIDVNKELSANIEVIKKKLSAH